MTTQNGNTSTTDIEGSYAEAGPFSFGPVTWDDATWILTSSFIIFTMQTGFGLLEAGVVRRKNEANIMVKNAIDVIFGGLSYWVFGFGLSFGDSYGSNPFCGIGYFFVETSEEHMGIVFSTFVFQLSFSTTATTIVSGAMAERTKLTAYIVFSFLNTLIYCLPAHWYWASNGFLRKLGIVDVAGSGVVHLVGGVSAFVSAAFLKPRLGRYAKNNSFTNAGNPVSSLIGTFILWWGWLAFNCGSTFGISGGKWKLASRSAVTTLNASVGGGVAGVIISFTTKKRKYDVEYLINSILGALVAITAPCAVVKPWESLVIGTIGGALAIASSIVVNKMKIDDPVSASSVHGTCGLWGLLAVGLFAHNDHLENTTQGRSGLFQGGGLYLFGVQLLGGIITIVWTAVLTLVMLICIQRTIGLRMSEEDEERGADFVEHMITIPSEEEYRHTVACMTDGSSIPNGIDRDASQNVSKVKRGSNGTTHSRSQVQPLSHVIDVNGDLTDIPNNSIKY
ncbi:hypothetical protein FSP39_006251 [Pinctada imbricata]|uniref:Ammonium transporter n=1 Tax=Pinctada imbricata TaxID=66713 RepID=A0AA88Y2Z5_PINIB|nr:hypothetical protein FSP39_006251 [Pinctada imbricata]